MAGKSISVEMMKLQVVVDFEGGSVTQDPLWLNFSLGPKEIEEQVADDPAG